MSRLPQGRPAESVPGLRHLRETIHIGKRFGKRITIQDAAYAVEISVSTLSRIERGQRKADAETLRMLAEFYRVSQKEIQKAYTATRRNAE